MSKYIRSSERTTMAWGNRGGAARELVVCQDRDGLLWRVSIAEVEQSGPLSPFPNLVRITRRFVADVRVLSAHGATSAREQVLLAYAVTPANLAALETLALGAGDSVLQMGDFLPALESAGGTVLIASFGAP